MSAAQQDEAQWDIQRKNGLRSDFGLDGYFVLFCNNTHARSKCPLCQDLDEELLPCRDPFLKPLIYKPNQGIGWEIFFCSREGSLDRLWPICEACAEKYALDLVAAQGAASAIGWRECEDEAQWDIQRKNGIRGELYLIGTFVLFWNNTQVASKCPLCQDLYDERFSVRKAHPGFGWQIFLLSFEGGDGERPWSARRMAICWECAEKYALELVAAQGAASAVRSVFRPLSGRT